MAVSRITSSLWRPLTAAARLRSSSVVPFAAGWGRHIATGRSYTRCRAMGSQDERLLEPFIGRWTEISCQGFHEFLDASGVPEDQQKVFRSSKLELVYSRLNGHWMIESGFHNLDHRMAYTFQIGKMFTVQMLVGPLLECTVTQDDALWLENYKSVTKPHYTMTVTNEVKGDTLTSVAKVKDVAVKRVFARE